VEGLIEQSARRPGIRGLIPNISKPRIGKFA
jgi:hypothetical protein